MKKVFRRFSGFLAALGILGFIFTPTVMAASAAYEEPIFEYAFQGKDADGNELVLAIYSDGEENFAFFTDGFSSSYGKCTFKDVSKKDNIITKMTTNDERFYYYEKDGVMYIQSEDDVLYTVEYTTEQAIKEIRKNK